MTKEIKRKIEEKIKFNEQLLADGMVSRHSYNCILLGTLDGLLLAGAITENERAKLYVKYKKRDLKVRGSV